VFQPLIRLTLAAMAIQLISQVIHPISIWLLVISLAVLWALATLVITEEEAEVPQP
jgi:hypothetical protein